MEKKKRFTIYYNKNDNIGFGKGYYFIYENYEGKPTFDCKYGTFEYSEDVDMVSVGLVNKIYYLYDMGYIFDKYYIRNDLEFKKIF